MVDLAAMMAVTQVSRSTVDGGEMAEDEEAEWWGLLPRNP
jgi:hypothetical protein